MAGPSGPSGAHEVLSKMTARPTSASGAPGASGAAAPSRASATAQTRLLRVHSEPALRQVHPGEAAAKARGAAFREGIADLMDHLDAQCAVRRKEHRRAEWAEKAKDAMRRQYQLSLDATRKPERPAWTYPDPAAYFQRPLIDDGPSEANVARAATIRKDRSQPALKATRGDAAATDFVPPTAELADFGEKPRHRMGPTERKFADRLDRTLARVAAAEKQDAINMTSGAYKRRLIQTSAGEFSSLRREKAPWTDQLAVTHVYFSEPEPSRPGDHKYEAKH